MRDVKRVLIVDDEEIIVEVLRTYLTRSGYTVYEAYNGLDAVNLFGEKQPSLVILDLMLPDILGEEICKRIRQQSRTPIIMLTAKADERDVVSGLHNGADDYIVKPFRAKEVLARVEAVLRRASGDTLAGEPVSFDDGALIIDFKSCVVKKNGYVVKLTATEYKLLSTLAKTPGRIFSRDDLIQFALYDDFTGYGRSIDTYIKNIRKKIESDPKKPHFLHTMHGIGYIFNIE
jgi:DNA-binding response OmpR family regulator